MKNLILYRKRLIPDECVLLKDDVILQADETHIVTSWKALHPKKDLHHGYSCYLLQEGIKISVFYREDHTLLYWYCDIVDYQYSEDKTTMTSVDLLADVIIYPDGFVKVVDLDELVTALSQNLITQEQLEKSLLRLNNLLTQIYAGKLTELAACILPYLE